MDRSTRKETFFPARCPGCDGVVHLLVGNSGQVTVQMHNVRGCGITFFYRCWIEQGLPLPRLEFIDLQNAKHFTLHPHPTDTIEPTTVEPWPPSSRAAHLPATAGEHRARGRAAEAKARGRRTRSS